MTEWPPVTACSESAGGAPAPATQAALPASLHPVPLLLSAGVPLPAGFLPLGLAHPVDLSLKGWSSWPGTCCCSGSSCVCPAAGLPASLPGSRLLERSQPDPPSLNRVSYQKCGASWPGAPTPTQHTELWGASWSWSDHNREEKRKGWEEQGCGGTVPRDYRKSLVQTPQTQQHQV